MDMAIQYTLPTLVHSKPDPQIIVHCSGDIDLLALNQCVYEWVRATYRYTYALEDTGDCSLSAYEKWRKNMIDKYNREEIATWVEIEPGGDMSIIVRDVTNFMCALKADTGQLEDMARGRYS